MAIALADAPGASFLGMAISSSEKIKKNDVV